MPPICGIILSIKPQLSKAAHSGAHCGLIPVFFFFFFSSSSGGPDWPTSHLPLPTPTQRAGPPPLAAWLGTPCSCFICASVSRTVCFAVFTSFLFLFLSLSLFLLHLFRSPSNCLYFFFRYFHVKQKNVATKHLRRHRFTIFVLPVGGELPPGGPEYLLFCWLCVVVALVPHVVVQGPTPTPPSQKKKRK